MSKKASKKALAQQNTFRGVWSQDEHDLFLEALQLHPQGPWKVVAEHIGTRSVRQVQTHAQKYHEKVARRLLGLRKERKKMVRSEHRIDDEMMNLCRDIEHNGRLSTVSSMSSSSQASSVATTVASDLSHHHGGASCESCGARPSSSFTISTPSSVSSYSSASSFASHHHSHHSQYQDPYEQEYDEIISFGDDDAIWEEEDENMNMEEQETPMYTGSGGGGMGMQPAPFDIQAEATARQVAAQHAAEEKRELPSFSDCLDFLIDAFSSSSSSSRHHNNRHHRWGR